MSKATTAALGNLHGQFAKLLSDGLKGMRDEEGNVVAPSASYLNIVRQFLKDNNIEAIPGASEEFDELVDGLPDFDQEGNVTYQS